MTEVYFRHSRIALTVITVSVSERNLEMNVTLIENGKDIRTDCLLTLK